MTSYTDSEKKADTRQSFNTQEQLGHIQVVPVQKENLPRTLRLTGAVAYNSFLPPQCSPPSVGRFTKFWSLRASLSQRPTAAGSDQPDYSASRGAFLKSRDAYALADKLYTRARIFTPTAPLLKPTWNRPKPPATRLTPIWNLPLTPSRPWP